MVLDYLGIRVNSDRAEGKTMCINLTITDRNETYVLNLDNTALTYTKKPALATANATINTSHMAFLGIAFGEVTLDDLLVKNEVTIEGDQTIVKEFVATLDTFDLMFNIVTP